MTEYCASAAISPFLAATIAGEDVILHPGQTRELPDDDPQVLAWLGLQLIAPVAPEAPAEVEDPPSAAAPTVPKPKSRS